MSKWFLCPDLRLQEALGKLRSDQLATSRSPLIVRIVENPDFQWLGKNILFIPGAMHLYDHDVMHVVLDRGLEPNDEAYVVGFTMGSTHKLGRLSMLAFISIARYLYPTPYRFLRSNLAWFRVGVEHGECFARMDVSTIREGAFADVTIQHLRKTVLAESYIQRYLSRRRPKGTALHDTGLSHERAATKQSDSEMSEVRRAA